ncbi:hypothetical protein GCM10023311_27810 [Flaviramulus aquimarinus]|uniref:tRNA_anti-like n=1 Tax=Flaviramulus aquimarinus TaxID=1170456 RepID=A0ABP9FG55_9FLAO
MRKWIILIILIISIVVGYNYIYQDHRDIKTETSSFSINSTEIHYEFIKNLEGSEQKYLNKTIEISGTLSEINKNNLTLNNHVFCAFDDSINIVLKRHTKIKIKGRVIGYDDLLEQVKLDQCYIIK